MAQCKDGDLLHNFFYFLFSYLFLITMNILKLLTNTKTCIQWYIPSGVSVSISFRAQFFKEVLESKSLEIFANREHKLV